MTTIMPETDVDTGLTIMDQVAPYVDDNDPNRRTHIVNPPSNPHISRGFPDMQAQEVVNIARAQRIEIVALCGYKFVPQHNPEKYDACDACMKIAGDIMRGAGE